ncbi:MAG: dTDP-glucose 4,6-dehydratase [Parcubacteria bacterium C7867-005]|nr:MAG: dTDP-glucose 4,6-dehydratase [Parcubacteria bacterium C7867-005]
MKTVLVTGGAGFIGSVVSRELLSKDYRVVCVDNFTDDLYDPALKEDNVKRLSGNTNFILYRTDICNFGELGDVFKKENPQFVVHLAARANTRKAVEEPRSYIDVNIGGTLNILELSKEHGVANIVIASSSSVYGNSTNMPLNENDPADRALSPYGMSKRADEILAFTYHHNFKMNITCLRYFNAYGENNRPDLVPYIWGNLILDGGEIEVSGDGSRSRDYTYVGDIADGTIKAMEKPLGFEVINLGNHRPVSLKELVTVFEVVTGLQAKVKSRPSNKASVETTYADITKAKKLLDWEPTTPIEEGIEKLITWLRDNRLKNIV